MSLRAKRLTAQQVAALWAEFYEAHGADVMYRAYGWTSPEGRPIRKGERVWEFWDDLPLRRVGWGACYLHLDDPDDVTATLVVGVFPDAGGHGYRLAILDWMSEWAKGKGAEFSRIIVFAENEANHKRHHREAEQGSAWVWAGDVWYPEQYSIFIRDLNPEPVAAEAAVAA